jgi:hypothetical protein
MMHDLNAANRFPSDPQDESGDTELVRTESASFQQFDEWMDTELAKLVQCWIHTAAPNANRLQLGRERFSH